MITIPATYYNWVVFPKKKISAQQLKKYDLTISLVPKKTDEELINEGLAAYKKGEFVRLPQKITKKHLSKLLWS
jgi:hypothetical protein